MTRISAPQGFTLVELLVVISIIAVLVSMLVPAVESAMKEARIAVCATNEHTVGLALGAYVLDHQQNLPWVGYAKNNAHINYVTYLGEGETPNPKGFQSLGLLGTNSGRYLSLQSPAWFCPLQTCDTGFMYSRGDPSFWSVLPNNWGHTLQAQDASLGWISRRTGYLRRRMLEKSDYESIKMTEIGSGAFLADVFSDPMVHVGKSHGDSVNVWFGDGSVVKRDFYLDRPPFNEPLLQPTYGAAGQAQFREFWNHLDHGN